MPYAYKNGYREGVVFVFLKSNNMVLIENRHVEDNKHEVFFTSGSIEDKDYKSKSDYKITAMLREVGEEFENNVNVKKYVYLDEMKVDEINVIFYIYLITEWDGNMPEYTVEREKKFADLKWIYLNEKEKYFKFESAFKICSRIEKYLEK
ncbi:hypothetical protein [Abyssisolibacter fermentans]|uniref:hypothetical protein n=1 Tax=Abyssisolibacter fermentans TaxID=1766203 RepID=UPI00083089ED|nr:hypothetical protein [Abyssisolibacter fermentans]